VTTDLDVKDADVRNVSMNFLSFRRCNFLSYWSR